MLSTGSLEYVSPKFALSVTGNDGWPEPDGISILLPGACSASVSLHM